jgi:hypothetical protein
LEVGKHSQTERAREREEVVVQCAVGALGTDKTKEIEREREMSGRRRR